MSEPHKVFVLEVTAEHLTEMVISQLQSEISRFARNHGIVLRIQSISIKYSHCKECGIPRKFGTLGTGISQSADKCRSAHSMACNRRAAKGGYKE